MKVEIITSLEQVRHILPYENTTQILLKMSYVKSRRQYRHSFHEIYVDFEEAWDSYYEEPYITGEICGCEAASPHVIIYTSEPLDYNNDEITSMLTALVNPHIYYHGVDDYEEAPLEAF